MWNERQRRVRHVSPSAPRSSTTCSMPRPASSWLADRPACPAPITTAAMRSRWGPTGGSFRDRLGVSIGQIAVGHKLLGVAVGGSHTTGADGGCELPHGLGSRKRSLTARKTYSSFLKNLINSAHDFWSADAL
jgi:hypothetical protein